MGALVLACPTRRHDPSSPARRISANVARTGAHRCLHPSSTDTAASTACVSLLTMCTVNGRHVAPGSAIQCTRTCHRSPVSTARSRGMVLSSTGFPNTLQWRIGTNECRTGRSETPAIRVTVLTARTPAG